MSSIARQLMNTLLGVTGIASIGLLLSFPALALNQIRTETQTSEQMLIATDRGGNSASNGSNSGNSGGRDNSTSGGRTGSSDSGNDNSSGVGDSTNSGGNSATGSASSGGRGNGNNGNGSSSDGGALINEYVPNGHVPNREGLFPDRMGGANSERDVQNQADTNRPNAVRAPERSRSAETVQPTPGISQSTDSTDVNRNDSNNFRQPSQQSPGSQQTPNYQQPPNFQQTPDTTPSQGGTGGGVRGLW